MVRDALRSYLSLASGLVDVPRQQAVRVAKALVTQGEATAEQAGSIAEELMGTSRANRDALLQVIRHEVDRGLSRLGLAAADELRDLRKQVTSLENEVAALRASGSGSASGKSAVARRGSARSGPAVSAPAKRTAAKPSGARKTSASAKGARKASGGSGAAEERGNGSTR